MRARSEEACFLRKFLLPVEKSGFLRDEKWKEVHETISKDARNYMKII